MKLLVVTCLIDNYSTNTSLHGLNLYHTEGLTDNSEYGIPYGLKQEVINQVDFKWQQSIGSRLRQENDNSEVQQPTICPQLLV
jgi:hypothetical protein